MDERLERHLCNLHNEVFEATESRINTEGSLTIREGVSMFNVSNLLSKEFPHYTWGCIAKTEPEFCRNYVPSLHVRVYRYTSAMNTERLSSLTTREGVSSVNDMVEEWLQFPHYTWGCIEINTNEEVRERVPSLHVRVYRKWIWWGSGAERSLTTREGVSPRKSFPVAAVSFPHYTRGCIETQNAESV